MKNKKRSTPVKLPNPSTAGFRRGLSELLWAYDYARDAGVDVWEFALEINELRPVGMTISGVRWLVVKGYAKHGQETSVYGDAQRSFRLSEGTTFVDRTSLVLSAKGAMFARKAIATARHDETNADVTDGAPAAAPPSDSASSNRDSDGRPKALAKPQWDACSRELRLCGLLVKGFRVPAHNQELILSAFQEQGWPHYIDDPLPGTADVVPEQRLHNAINRLNGSQTRRLINFYGNGSGRAVGWERVAAKENGFRRQAKPNSAIETKSKPS